MSRVKINSLYLYKKTQSEKNALGFLDRLAEERDGLTKAERAEVEDMSVIHRRMYLAGMYLEMIDPQLTEFLSRAIDEDKASVEKLGAALTFLGLSQDRKWESTKIESSPVKANNSKVDIESQQVQNEEVAAVQQPKPESELSSAVGLIKKKRPF